VTIEIRCNRHRSLEVVNELFHVVVRLYSCRECCLHKYRDRAAAKIFFERQEVISAQDCLGRTEQVNLLPKPLSKLEVL